MAVCSTFSILLLFPIRGRTQTLTNGALTTDTLLANRTNFYSFQGTNGDAILLRVGSALMNPSIVLRNPLGQVFASAGSGVSGVHDANIAVQSTNTGTFTVEVSSIFAGGAGAYNLNLARVPGDFVVLPGDDGGPITNGWINTGTNSLGDMDLWSLTANAGDSIVLRMGSATFNPWIRVYGPDGKEVATAGNGTSGFLTVDLATQATNSGTYVVVTSSFSVDGVGNYLLTLAKSPGTVFVAPGDEGGPMTNGWEHAGIISPGDLDVWTFNANAGDGIVLRMGSPAFNPWIRLFGPDGKEVATAGSGVSGFLNVDMTTQATNAGTYTVVVGSFSGNVTGSYVLNLAKPGAVFVAPGDEGGPMTNGWKHTGNLDLGDLDVWTFDANAGDNIVLRMGSTNYNPFIRLYGPDGKTVATAGSGVSGFLNVEVATQATNSGTYTVVASSFSGNSTGNYILNLAQPGSPVFVAPGDEGGPMTNGWKHLGNIDLGDLDVWTFDANPRDTLVFRMGATNYNPWIRLYGPGGKLVVTAGSGVSGVHDQSFSVTATNGGAYTVIATSFNGNAIGVYLLNMARMPGTFSVAPNDEGGVLFGNLSQNGTIDIGDMDIWHFGECRGQAVTLSCQKLSGTFTPRIRLYARDGTLLASAASTPTATLVYSATNSSIYTAIVDGNGVNDTGAYLLTGNGFTDELNLCPLIVTSTTNFDFAGTGGTSNAAFVIYTSTNLTTPLSSWTPILTNHFDSFGAFELTNHITPRASRQFFKLAEPQ